MIDDLKNPNWAESTWHGALMYFKRRVLPRLDQYGEDICSEDLKDIESELVMKGLQSGRSRQDTMLTKASVSSYLYRVDQILDSLYARYPLLPKAKFNAKIIKIPSAEQAKYIPDKVRVRLAMLRPSLVENGETMGVGMMFYHGTRTAESCAPLIDEMMLTEGWYVSYYVAHQIRKGARWPILKTEAGYRYTISGKMMHTLIALRIEYLLKQGYTMEEILKMPLAGKYDNP